MIMIRSAVSQPEQVGFGGSNNTSVCPVGNPIEFVFEADPVLGNAQPATGAINFFNSGSAADGEFFTFNGIPFFARNNPGLRDFQAGVPANQVAERVYQLLSDDPVLSVNYDFEFFTPTPLISFVTFRARSAGTIYNINLTFNVFSAAISGATFSADNANVGQGLADFGVYLKLVVDKSDFAKTNLSRAPLAFGNTDYETIQQLFTAKLNPSNRMAIDISGALAPFVRTKAPALWDGGAPQHTGILLAPQNFKTAPEMLARYYVEYGVEFIPSGATTPTRQIIGTVGKDITASGRQLYAAHSALPLQTNKSRSSIRFKDWWQDEIDITKFDFLPRKILHNYPTWKLTHIDAIELIYFYKLRHAVRGIMMIKWSYQYEDGATGVHYGVICNIPIEVGTAYYVEVGYRQLVNALPSIESTKLLARWTVEIVEIANDLTTVTPLTVPQSYELLNEKRCEVFDSPQLLWENPLGGFDGWMFTGAYDRDTSAEVSQYSANPKFIDTVTGQEYETALDNRTRPDEIADTKSYGAVSRSSFTLRTTGLDEAHVRWLQESLIPSTQIYMIAYQENDNAGNPEARYVRRVELKTRELSLKKYQNNYAVEIEVEQSLRNQTLP